MAQYTIYSPFNGKLLSSNCYCSRKYSAACASCTDDPLSTLPRCKDNMNCYNCSGCTPCSNCCKHTVVGEGLGFSLPLDISAPYNAFIYAYLGATIGSIKYIHMTGVCATFTGDVNNGVWVEAYVGLNATGKKLGRLLYAHTANRTYNDGAIINHPTQTPGTWSVTIGKVPDLPNNACYRGTHTHFSIFAESGVSKSRTSAACETNLAASTSPIYWWTY